jgi:hypothetical protein
MVDIANLVLPNISGRSLSFMESPGTDFICLIFQEISDDRSKLTMTYVYLYGARIEGANFSCNPFFPPTISATFSRKADRDCVEMEILFDPGKLAISFADISFHVATQALQRG